MIYYLKSLTFAQPYWFLLLALIPVFIFFYISRRNKQQAGLQLSSTAWLEINPVKTLRQRLIFLPFSLRMLVFAFLVIVLARPQSSLQRKKVNIEGIDIIMALDVSGSMRAMDLKPNRLDAAKKVAQTFIDGRQNDRIGLVIFSGEAFTQCPLTTDHKVLKDLFKPIHSGMIEDGTAIGDGLATAINRIKDSKAISRVIILLTDGVQNRGSISPVSAAEIAKSYGIRIYTIGVGTKGTASAGLIKDHKGKVIWRHRNRKAPNPYQVEHNELYRHIREDKPINNAHYAAEASMSAIIGRMATYSGQEILWEEALKSGRTLVPQKLSWDIEPGPKMGKNGLYPCPVPGKTKVIG